jgi:site-specific DNA recombinase
LDLDSVPKLVTEVARRGWVTPLRNSRRAGQQGGRPFSRGHLYRIIQNPIYIGRIQHRKEVFDGQHPAIIDMDLWDRVQARIAANLQGHRTRPNASYPSLLSGLVFDSNNNRLIACHANKGQRRYRYYVSQDLHTQGRGASPDALRVPARELEGAVIAGITGLLRDEHRLMGLMDTDGEQGAKQIRRCLGDAVQLANRIDEANTSGRIALLNRLVQGIRVSTDRVVIEIRISRLLESGTASSSDTPVDPSEVTVSV